MIAAAALAIVAGIIEREGSRYTNLAADRGGPTRWGITQATLSAWRIARGLPPATPADVEALTREEATTIYVEDYIVAPHFDQVQDPYLQELLVDAGVQHDPRHAAKWVQWAAEVKQDGVLGPVSLAAINACAPLELYLWVLAFRIRLYGRLVSDDQKLKALAGGASTQAIFAAGWNNRAAGFLEAAARRIEADWKGRTS